ncbi:Dephospho-CoA kinase [invertebrate metagenome]|uniref:Dephospho-CoA kinase n=1 Tax=invertebrate metagenome TaxID=1711999 RepID=A0A2H9TCH1_9ZZZZ
MSIPFTVGVTGGIGCGKTVATDYFSGRGITIVDADLASRVVVKSGKPALDAIVQRHGHDILKKNGTLNRRKMRNIIFTSRAEKRWLEELLHPLINQQLRRELGAVRSLYAILVSPLMVETGQIELVDRLLVIDISEEVQLIRTMQRDKMTEVETQRIIDSQTDRKQRLSLADDIVDNSGSITKLHQQLEICHQHYLMLAKNFSQKTASNVQLPHNKQ